MAEPQKPRVSTAVRRLDAWVMALPLPRVRPNLISGLSILASLLAILAFLISPLLVIVLVFLVLVLDYLDGVIARKHSLTSEGGYHVDVAADRLSEGILFSLFFFPWFYFFALNCLLTMVSFTRGKHLIIPLRHLFLVYLIVLSVL